MASSALTPVTTDGLVDRVGTLRVAHAPTGPRLYQPITLLWAVGRAFRGEPRTLPWEETRAALGRLLTRHGLRGERARPDYPVLALHNAGLWTLHGSGGAAPPAHGDAELRRWCAAHRPVSGLAEPVHALLRTSGEARVAVIQALVGRFYDGLDETPLLEDLGLYDAAVADDGNRVESRPRARPATPPGTGALVTAAQYERWCALAERREESARGRRRAHLSEDPIRSAAARRAVLIRSGGRCESPGCAGQPDDVTDRGDPILEVDHVLELTRGGRDHPGQMIALCPNCHAVKTRGSTREELRAVFRTVARERHLAHLRRR
ncbi:HNH endonuclease signature motif containing protein [Streptomyces longispororuber]|uniref:HNH endonuclease signature motif containing protein n=1 Tax=Streptomyces longispororuber TaxID=68230 RepID=UPI00167E1752|nr:HNH endonuclease signature motif containing protein [Streptomyces longispororuber]